MYRTKCIVCDSGSLKEIIDLGLHPFADTFLKEQDLEHGEAVFPLICDLCSDCGHVQLRCATDPNERYVSHDYSYTSSNSAFARNHWDEYAKHVAEKLKISSGFVVEVGSNDGYLAEQFAKSGFTVLGVDPSPYMAKLAKERGVDTEVDLFTSSVAVQIKKEHGAAKLVCANNVFNHSETPADFVKAAAQLLDDTGTFVFELPYWHGTITSGKFDQIYHEHVSYFTVTSSEKVLEQAGLKIVHVEIVDYHGGSLRVYAQKTGSSEEVAKHKQIEQDAGLFDVSMYERFMKDLLKNRAEFLAKLYDIKKSSGTIIAVGAAAKGNTFLNFYSLNSSTLSYVTDVSKHKQNKYTPYTRIPIRADEIFAKVEKPYALILSWNISDTLKKILRKINPDVQFISPWEK